MTMEEIYNYTEKWIKEMEDEADAQEDETE